MVILSVVIATYNSEKTLNKVLNALRNQTISQEEMEILTVDGMSTDSTRQIAKKYGCKVIDNPKVEQGNAKILGLQNAMGQYVLFVDSDEVLENKNALKNSIEAFRENEDCHWLVCSGYKKPNNYAMLSGYISDFGDPFSFFIYKYPKDYRFYRKVLTDNYKILKETEKYIAFDCDYKKKFPLIEGACGGSIMDMSYFEEHYPECKTNVATLYHSFYLMLERGETHFLYIKKDPLAHYSSDTLSGYFNKLKWRIRNNIHFADKASSVYDGRSKFDQRTRTKKYLFVPYTLSLVFPVADGIMYAMSRKNPIYLLHFVFSYYVLINVIMEYLKKILHIKPKFVAYGTRKEING